MDGAHYLIRIAVITSRDTYLRATEGSKIIRAKKPRRIARLRMSRD